GGCRARRGASRAATPLWAAEAVPVEFRADGKPWTSESACHLRTRRPGRSAAPDRGINAFQNSHQ
ncbi:MAG TPA: hypothetical protein VHB50_12695, partial [Bryobacteraceae bacterium]|nr:hypothetical protein [Bryobacteraceae bacterium]